MQFKGGIFKLFFGLTFLAAFASELKAQVSPVQSDDRIVLIIASYNPDTRRMSEFIGAFEQQLVNKDYGFKVLIENLGCKGVDDAHLWKGNMKTLLSRYLDSELKAVILLGQEAWVSYVMQDYVPRHVPFFSCFASSNGIELPAAPVALDSVWQPESIDMREWAKKKGVSGGYLNTYDIKKNIDLIRALYPNTKNVAFVSDNTYGGISLQSLVRKELSEVPDINFIAIDSRLMSVENIEGVVDTLPANSAILVGTWRVDMDGAYFLTSSLEALSRHKSDTPVFTLSGTGSGTVALGGYIPKYDADPKIIADQIYHYYRGGRDSVYFIDRGGSYVFDKKMLSKWGIKEYQLPKGSKVLNPIEEQLRKYHYYFSWAVGFMVVLSLFSVVLMRMYLRNKRLKDSLVKNERELIISKERAEEGGRLKSAFLANMSHEIRTPLNAIVGFSTLLCDETVPAESRTEFSQIIMTNSNLLLTLINDVLDISRLDTGKVSFDFREGDLGLVCHQIMATTDHLRKNGVEFDFRPSHEQFMLYTDMQRLMQVLINLTTNACKFTESGTITIGYEVRVDKNDVLMFVEDTGCGIPKEKHSTVFNRFEKLDEYKQGTGLGLPICKEIIARLGGDIWIDSEYVSGTKFVFNHPLSQDK